MRSPWIDKIELHTLCECAHGFSVIFEGLACSGRQRQGASLFRKKSVYAHRFLHFLQCLFGVPGTAGACVIVGDGNMPTDTLYKRGAAFEVVGQGFGCCKGTCHASGF